MNLQTIDGLSQMMDRIIKKHGSNIISKDVMSNVNFKKSIVPKRTSTRPKVVIFEPAQKKSNTMSKKSGYDPAKVKAERKKKGLSVTFSGSGSSKIIKQPNHEPYNPAKAREHREKRKEPKATVKVQNSVRKPVFVPKTPKMSSGYNPAKVRGIREHRNGEKGKGLIEDFDKYMIK